MLIKLEFSRQFFEKYSNIKFHENPYSGSRVIHADGRTDMAELFTILPTLLKEYKNWSRLHLIKHHAVKENGRVADVSTHSFLRHQINVAGHLTQGQLYLPRKKLDVPT
jgi:hypothetical protein